MAKSMTLATEKPILPYPTRMTKKVGETRFAEEIRYCPGIYPVKTIPLSPEQYGIRMANRKGHKK